MTGAQKSCRATLSEEAKVDCDESLAKAQAAVPCDDPHPTPPAPNVDHTVSDIGVQTREASLPIRYQPGAAAPARQLRPATSVSRPRMGSHAWTR